MLADRAMAPMVLTPHGSWWLGDLPLIPVRYEQAASLAIATRAASGLQSPSSWASLPKSFDVSPSSGVIETSFRNNLPLSAARDRGGGASPFRWPQ